MTDAHPTLRFADLFGGRGRAGRALLGASDLHPTYNGRAALFQVFRAIRELRGGTILVPAFHCPTVVDPALRAGFDVAFYRIRGDLTIDLDDLRARATGDVAAVVVIHYLGFPADLAETLPVLRERGCLLIDDWAHSFLRAAPGSLSEGGGDATVYSFYKLAPTYAGGGFRIQSPAVRWHAKLARVPLMTSVVIWKRLLEQAIENSGNVTLRGLFGRLERARVALKRRGGEPGTGPAPVSEASMAGPLLEGERDPYEFDPDLAIRGMPAISKLILGSIDMESIVAARRRNYAAWNDGLLETIGLRRLKPHLPDDVCPWAYPVLLDDRGAHDHVLRAQGVPLFTFGERLHTLFNERASGRFPEAESLSRNLLLLSVHQNLTPDLIGRACETVNAHFRGGDKAP